MEARNVFVFSSKKLVARKEICRSISVEFAVLSLQHCFVVIDTCVHTAVQTQWLMSLSADCVIRAVTDRVT